jgi:hypothetical protein
MVGYLVSLPIILLLRESASREIMQAIPKAFATLTSVIGMFMILESKHNEHKRNNKNLIIEVSVVAWIAGICALWFIY